MYVIRNADTGKYVAVQGMEHSYTSRLEHARVFRTREAAELDRCPENEVVLGLEQVLQRPQ